MYVYNILGRRVLTLILEYECLTQSRLNRSDLDAKSLSQATEKKSSFDNATWDVSKALVGHDYNQIRMTNWKKVIFEYVCPTLGIFISTALYSAPVKVSGIVRSCFYEKRIHLISSDML